MLTLTATNLPRFISCNGHRLMPRNEPFNIDDTDRNEGNAAHWLVEQVHSGKYQFDELVDRKAFNGVFITEEMVEYVTPYLNAIKGKGQVECITSHSDGQRYTINGRADHVEYNNIDTLFISDFKYGWGIVEPIGNWTLISHAIGWLIQNQQYGFTIKNIVFRIYQPRPHHVQGKIREWVCSIEEFQSLTNQLFHQLYNPDDKLRTSEHCRKCPALASCPAAAKAGMNALDVADTAFASEMTDGTLGFMLDQYDRAIKILTENRKAYAEKALHRIKAGAIVPGYARESELTNKQWKEGVSINSLMIITGKDLSRKELMTPTQAIKAGLREELADNFCERREKGSKLVRINASQQIKKLFGNL